MGAPVETETSRNEILMHDVPPPLFNQVLRSLNFPITGKEMKGMIDAGSPLFQYDLSHHMTREIDASGFTPFLRYLPDMDSVQTALLAIGQSQIEELKNQSPSLQTEVFEALRPDGSCTFGAFQALNEQYQRIVGLLQQRGGGSESFDRRNTAHLLYLRAKQQFPDDPDQKITDYIDKNLERLSNQLGASAVFFYAIPCTDNTERVQYLHRTLFFSHLSMIHRKELERLTPPPFRQDLHVKNLDPQSPLGFIQHIGKVGDTLNQLLLDLLKKKGIVQADHISDNSLLLPPMNNSKVLFS